MSTFRTTDGTEWTIAVNVGTVKRVRELTDVNLLGLIGDSAVIADVFRDDMRLAEVLAAVVQPQFEKAGKTPDDFYAAIDGTVIEQAAEALLAEIANFFPEPRRSVLRKAMDKAQAATKAKNDAGIAAALEALESMEVEIPSLPMPTNSASSLPVSAA